MHNAAAAPALIGTGRAEVAVFGEREAARFVGYSVAFLRMARQKNRGPAYVRIGRSIRYRIEDLEAWLSAHRVRTQEAR